MNNKEKLKEAAIDFTIKTIEAVTMVVATCVATEVTNTFFDNLHEACEPKKKGFFGNKKKNTKR